jgi:VWFA-related protein
LIEWVFPVRAWRKSRAWCFLRVGLLTAFAAYGSLASSENNSESVPVQPNLQISTGSDGLAYTAAQSVGGQPPFDLEQPEGVAAYCQGLARGKEQGAALEAVCEFSLSLRWKIPNVICDQETERSESGELGEVVGRDIIKAKVRYEGGQEQYSQITIDGKPAQSAMESLGAWSEGEFATDLRNVFLPRAAAEFKFTKQEALHATQALVFEFRVERGNNRSWYLKTSTGATTFPGYRGRLWINKSNLHLMRLERRAVDIESNFPIQQVNTVIDYGDVDLADGTSFVLPLQAVNLTCPTIASGHCWHNQGKFKRWQKFAARTRVLTGEEPPSTPSPTAAPLPDVVSLPALMDLRRGTNITAEILNAQIAEVESRQKQAEVAATPRVEVTNLSPKTQSPAQAPVPALRAANPATELPGDQVPTFKTSVRLVLVPAVVRDSRGQTVDYLQKPDFRLLDDRKPQLITQFSVERPGIVAAVPARSADEASAQAPAPALQRYAAYVFDDIHAALDDLVRARDAAQRHLTSLQGGDHAGIFTLSGTIALDFTDDQSKLREALLHIRPHPLTATGSVRCPDISYAQAELIQNNDSTALAQATDEAMRCAYPGDPDARMPAERLARDTASQVLIAGRAESQRSLNTLREVVRRISGMAGQRSVVLVSSGFPVAEMQQEATEIIDSALRAEVIINVLDPAGLSKRSAIELGSTSTPSDLLVDLASGTGGTFFHNRNDVDEGFQKTALPEIFYILGFSPQKLDGKFHSLKVILQRPEKLSLQARRGFYALKPTD